MSKLLQSETAETMTDMQFVNFIEMTGLRWDIAENMKQWGGSFVKALSDCVLTADATNLYALVHGFRRYFNEYLPHKWNK